jgi:hypothetical protein
MHLCKKNSNEKKQSKEKKKNIDRDMWQYIQERMAKKNLICYHITILFLMFLE